MGTGDNLSKGSQKKGSHDGLVEKLMNEIASNLNNEQFGVDRLAQTVGMSRSSLHRKLQKRLGISTSQFIREYRLKRALEILRQEDVTASEVAYRVGFSSSTYFSTSFLKLYGYTPGEVKNRIEISASSITANSNTENKTLWLAKPSPRKFILLVLVILGLLPIGFYIVNAFSKANYRDEIDIMEKSSTSIAILPFKNLSNNKESEYFAAGVAQIIQIHLNKITGIKLISDTSMAQYAETTKTSPEIASEINVSHLLEASVQEYDDRVRVIVKLIDAKKDEQIWSDTYDRNLVDIFNIQSEISKQIASELELVLSPNQIRQIERIPTKDIEVYNLYQKGKHFFNLKDHSHGKGEKSIQYFKQAIEKDPEFALAYVALATAYLFSGENLYKDDSVKLVEELALKAIALDNTISEAHVALGTLAYMYEWDMAKAQKEYQHAIQLNPNNSNAYIYYSQFLFSVRGESYEAREHIDKALRLDPLSYVANLKSAQYYFYEGKYDKAFEETSKLKEINGHNMFSYWINVQLYNSQGFNDKGIAELVDYFERVPPHFLSIDTLKISYKNKGLNGVYRYYIDSDLRAVGAPSNLGEFGLYADAQTLGYIGDTEKALEYLEIAFERHSIYLCEIKYDPYFINLRSECRFLSILDKMNLGGYN
ncbi:MAG TPA: helix-turn-helix domain-containing protein [Pricia sp.]|nr:helix-turn-helix domain-containing protein [Pricia sp.]